MLHLIQFQKGKWPADTDVVFKKARLHLSDVVPWQTVSPLAPDRQERLPLFALRV